MTCRSACARGELQAAVRSVLDALSESLTCALHGTDLAAVSAEALARHLVDCTTCTNQIGLMHSLGDVPGWLKSVETNPDGASRVEQVLAVASAQGTEELARLLYEMFRACLAMRSGFAATSWLLRAPDSLADLTRSAHELAARTSDQTAALETSVATAARCVDMLELVSPGSDRSRFARARMLQEEGQHEEALSGFQALARDPDSREIVRSFSKLNMLHSLLELAQHSRVLDLAAAMIEAGEHTKHAALYRVLVAGWRTDPALFESAAAQFRAVTAHAEPADWWRQIIQHQAPWLAARLQHPVEHVLQRLSSPDTGAES